jgi:phage recombination protein Bet
VSAANGSNGASRDADSVRIGRAPAIDSWDERMVELVARQILKPKNRRPTYGELAMLAEHAERTGLNPMLRQLYGIYRRDRNHPQKVTPIGSEVEVTTDEYMVLQTAIDGLRLVAQRTGAYEGQEAILYCGTDRKWTEVWLSEQPPVAAKAQVWRKGARRPTVAVALWAEYSSDGPLKDRMPALMLGKVAEAQALRKAFPADTSGLYIPEEMAQADNARPALPAAATGTVDLSAFGKQPEPEPVEATATEVPKMTADKPKPTVKLATAAQQRKILAERGKHNLPDAELGKIIRELTGSSHQLDRLPQSQVYDVLEAIDDPDRFWADRKAAAS